MKISPVKNNVAPKILVDKSIQEPYLGGGRAIDS